MRYCIKTLYWGRYHDMYGDEWVDQEHQQFTDDLNEAITYCNDQLALPKTIQSAVFETGIYDQVYPPTDTIDATKASIDATNDNDQTN